jgi:hypothetical protein
MMRTHLEKTAIVLALLADEDRLDRRLHVIVDAARAGALEEGEGTIMRVEHHFLRFARISAKEKHPAMAEADMRDLQGHGHATQHHDLVTPVELVGFAWRKTERHIRLRQSRAMLLEPAERVAPDSAVAPAVTEAAHLLE